MHMYELEGIGIANKIQQFFNTNKTSKDQSSVSEVDVYPIEAGKSQLRLNLNLNVEIDNGRPKRLTLPQGILVIMFIPNTVGNYFKKHKKIYLICLRGKNIWAP
jgi:hypothetical protein